MQSVDKVVFVPKQFRFVLTPRIFESSKFVYTKMHHAKYILNGHKFENLQLKMKDEEFVIMKQLFHDEHVIITESIIKKYLRNNDMMKYYDNVNAIIMALNENSIVKQKMDCDICMDEHNIHIKFACGHHICEECYEQLLKVDNLVCPYCRRTHSTDKITAISGKKYDVILNTVKASEDIDFHHVRSMIKK